jgi:hypothetical protein
MNLLCTFFRQGVIMNNPISLSMFFLLAILFSTLAVSAQKGQTGQVDPAASKREQDYLGALKRCESMTGPAKSQCIDAARKSYGQL